MSNEDTLSTCEPSSNLMFGILHVPIILIFDLAQLSETIIILKNQFN